MKVLVNRLNTLKPSSILECGSGLSTVVLTKWAQEHDSQFIALEHDPKYFEKTVGMLQDFGLDKDAVRFAPLVQCTDEKYTFIWYSMDFEKLERKFDFVLVDGPPGAVGRYGALPQLAQHLADSWEVWLDDYERDHEKGVLAAWQKIYGGETSALPVGHQIGILQKKASHD